MGLVWQPVTARLRNPTSLFGGWLCSCVHFLWRENITEYTQVTDSKSWVSPPRGGGGEIARGGGFKRGRGGLGRPIRVKYIISDMSYTSWPLGIALNGKNWPWVLTTTGNFNNIFHTSLCNCK